MSPKEPQGRPRQVLGKHSRYLSLLQPNYVHEQLGLLESTSAKLRAWGVWSLDKIHKITVRHFISSWPRKRWQRQATARSSQQHPQSTWCHAPMSWLAPFNCEHVSAKTNGLEIRINKYVAQGCCTETTCIATSRHSSPENETNTEIKPHKDQSRGLALHKASTGLVTLGNHFW